jgi:hypothetical protein
MGMTKLFTPYVFHSAATSIYRYMRILDDCADESAYVLPVMQLITQERRALLGFEKPTPFQEELITKPLDKLFGDQSNRARLHLNRILAGLMIDLNIRYTQQPPT